jgi:hypothetical protein
MSTLKSINVIHPSSATNNIVNDASGNVAIGNNLTVAGTVTSTGTVAMGSSFKRNRIINGNMVVDQRNAGASVTPTATSANTYLVDRWMTYITQASKLTFQQNAGSVTPPAGFKNYLGVISTSAYSVVSSDVFVLRQAVEGFNVADFGWGTASAQTVTLSFWVRSSLTGTFGGSIANDTGARAYAFSFTISTANTWTQISVTVAGDTSGTWLSTNGCGMFVGFNLGAGATALGTPGVWTGSYLNGPTGATNIVSTNGATFYITGVQLEVGTVATPYEMQIYSDQLAQCQRYYQQLQPEVASASSAPYYYSNAGSAGEVRYPLSVTMRTAPTASTVTQINGTVSTYSGMVRMLTTTSSGYVYFSTLSAEL